MKISLRYIYTGLFMLGVFFIPFNSWMGIKQLGEFKTESSAFFFLLGFVVLIVEMLYINKVPLPYTSFAFKLLMVFLLWIILTIIFNLNFIHSSYYKKTTGFMRFIRQYFALVLSCCIFLTLYYNVLKKLSLEEVLKKLRRVFLYSFIFVTIYGFLEISYVVFGFYPSYYLLKLINYFPFTEFDKHTLNRISSVTFEPPALATFLITVSGWMFSYIITHKSYVKYLPTLCVLVLTYYSGSRTALIVIIVQLFLFLVIILTKKQIRNAFLLLTIIGVGTITILLFFNSQKIIYDLEKKVESLDFKGNLRTNISNQSRFGIQYANLIVFTENPIIGVGYGQQGFHAINHYPIWAKKNNYEFEVMYLNKNNPMFPPGYNLYIRLLAETGMIGLFLFCYLLFVIIRNCNLYIKSNDDQVRILAIILKVSFVGFMLNYMQLDTFRIYGFWICFVVLLKISADLKRE